MGFLFETRWSLLLLILPTLVSCSNTQHERLGAVQRALASLEIWVEKTDAIVQDRLFDDKDRYGPWSECTEACGVGYKWRNKTKCTDTSSPDYQQTLFCNAHPCPIVPTPPKTRNAICLVSPDANLGSSGTVQGLVTLTQTEYGALVIRVDLSGFQETDPRRFLHGFHIHQYGDLSGGCATAGGHFNPRDVRHGGKLDSVRHVGDLGNIQQTEDGRVMMEIIDERASLFGADSIVGRAIVVHEDEDDLGRGGNAGSETTGNAGRRLACCVIGLAAPLT